MVISELHTWPVCTPVNASPASFRTQTHDSEPKWCATPFLCGSLIRYSMPVYPGASLMTFSARMSTTGGIVSPRTLAVFKLIISCKLRRLLDRNVGWLGTFQDLVDHHGRPLVRFDLVRSVGHQATKLDKISTRGYRRQSIFYR